MCLTEKEQGVLKLVHPGRFVEIHKEPITAYEVLQKNPRHSITRPDFFEYPWIVVKPEAILNLGKVFFIVPNHAIYHMLKAHKDRHQHCSCQSQLTTKNHNQQQAGKQNSPRKSDAGMTPKHPNHHQCLKQSFPTTFCIGETFEDPNCDKRLREQSKVESCSKLISKLKNTHLDHERILAKDSTAKIRSSHHKQCYYSDSNMSSKL